jgi:hypothetical protein
MATVHFRLSRSQAQDLAHSVIRANTLGMRLGSIVLSGLVFGCSTVPSARAAMLTHRALVAGGHSDITEQILGSNLLRVLEANEVR